MLGTAEIIPAVVELVNNFRAAGRPIVHAIRLYVPGGSDVDLVRREAIEQGARVVAPGSIGAQIPASLTGNIPLILDHENLLRGQPQEIGVDEMVIYKPRWSAFFRTGLSQWLADRDITSVIVAGCNLPNCPRATLFDASARDLRAAVVVDATSQVTPERLADLSLIGVQQVTVAEVLSHLS